MPTRYTVTIVTPGSSPVLDVPFEPSALVSTFVTELWKRIAKLAIPVEPNTHRVTLHLDSQNGTIINSEDLLGDVVVPATDKLYATFAEVASSSQEPIPTSPQDLSIRVITPERATLPKKDIKPLNISSSATIKELHQKVADHLGLPEAFDKPALEHECNCNLAKQLADGAASSTKLVVVHGKSIVQRYDITELATENVLNDRLKTAFGDALSEKKLNYHGAEYQPSAFSVQDGARTYKKPPVVAICSKQRHTPTHAKAQYDDDELQLRRRLDLHTDETPISRACFDTKLAAAGLGALEKMAPSTFTPSTGAPPTPAPAAATTMVARHIDTERIGNHK